MSDELSPTVNGKPSRKSSWRWPLILIGLLTGHATIMMVCVAIATNDKTFAVPPDYYGRAIHWDERQAALRASEQLGWKASVEAANEVDPLGRRIAAFRLVDASGNAIPGATMEVSYYHHAHGRDVQRLELKVADAADPRQFSGLFPMRYSGFWEFEFTAKAHGKTFVATTTQWIGSQAK